MHITYFYRLRNVSKNGSIQIDEFNTNFKSNTLIFAYILGQRKYLINCICCDSNLHCHSKININQYDLSLH